MANAYPPAYALVLGTDAGGRARITFPHADVGTAVARVCKNVGPLSPDDEVMVVFAYGDMRYPVIVGKF